MKVSNCCGERGDWGDLSILMNYEQAELCPKCGEHCEYVEEEETQKTALMELIEWVKKEPYVINRSDLIAKATELLQKERQQIEDANSKGLSKNCFYGVNHQAQKAATDYYNKTYKQ